MLLEGQNDTGDTSDTEVTEALREAGGEAEPAAEALPPAPEPNKPVALAPKLSRRAQAEEERNNKIKELADTIKELRERDSARDRKFGELTGHISVLAQQRQAPVQQQQAPAAQLPDPEELLAKANAALDGRDMQGYHRLLLQANQAATMRQMAPILERVQQYQQNQPAPQAQIPPVLMPFYAAYPEVAAHPQQLQLLHAKNVELGARGWRDGPEKVKAIFEEVQAIITAGKGNSAARPGFDRSSAAALSGTPTARPANGGGAGKGEPRVDLTPAERMYWKKAGFTDESELANNIAQSNPSRVVR